MLSPINKRKAIETAKAILSYGFETPPNIGFYVLFNKGSEISAEIFKNAGNKINLGVKLILLNSKNDYSLDMFDESDYNVVINLFSKSKKFLAPVRKHIAISERNDIGLTVAHAVDVTPFSFIEGRMSADMEEIFESSLYLQDKLLGVEKISVTSPIDTDITFSVKKRRFTSDAPIKNGKIGNLPLGEVYCAIIEDSANGRIIVDGSITDHGLLKRPLSIWIKDGKRVRMKTEDLEAKNYLISQFKIDEGAKRLGEFGIGLVDNGKLSGRIIEDEKAAQTCHFAFGDNTEFPGGKNKSDTHNDLIIQFPTITAYRGNTSFEIMRSGEIIT